MSKITAWEQIKTQMDAGKTVELQQAIAVFREASSNEDGYYSENDHLAELEQLFLIPDLQWTGPSASFHNLAVSFSRADKNRSVLSLHPPIRATPRYPFWKNSRNYKFPHYSKTVIT